MLNNRNNMNDGEEVREGMFEWKVENFMQRRTLNKESPKFKLGRDDSCWLCIPYNTLCYTVFLNSSQFEKFKYNAFCKLCLIDNRGREFLVTKRIQLHSGISFIPLMVIGLSELSCEENELLQNDVLTLRLSWSGEDSFVSDPDINMAPDSNSEKVPIKLFDTLSDDFSRFFESKKNTDCVLKVSNAQFPVHRAVLSARSEVFAAMFHHDTSENRCGEVDIPDIDKTVLSYVLQYMYSGQIHGLSTETAAPMYIAADKYSMIELRCVCLDVLKRSLTIDNVCEAALLAHIHGEAGLEEKVVQFFKIRFEEIEETIQWKELLQAKPLLAVKLLRSALLANKK